MNPIQKIDLQEKFSLFSDHWHPRIISELNGQQVKLAKLKGEFVWHQHDDEDELFLVIKGTLHMELRDQTIVISEGQMITIPRGTEHRPVAPEEVHVLLFEPASTHHTGNVQHELTRNTLDRI